MEAEILPYKNNIYQPIKCICGNIAKYHHGHGYVSCSKKCTEDVKKQTNMERFGIDNFSKTSIFKDRNIKTNMERYGVKYTFKIDGFKEKSMQACMKRYGVDNGLSVGRISHQESGVPSSRGRKSGGLRCILKNV